MRVLWATFFTTWSYFKVIGGWVGWTQCPQNQHLMNAHRLWWELHFCGYLNGGAFGLTTKQSCKQMGQKIFLNLVSIIFKQIVSVRGGGEETAVISSLSNPLAVYRLWMVLVKLGRDRTCGENDQILSDT